LTQELVFLLAAAEFNARALKEPAELESSIGLAEHLSREVCNLLARVRSTLVRVWDTSVPDSISDSIAGILEALAVKADSEDPLVVAVRRQVTISSESVFSMMMMHDVEFDADKITSTYPKDKDGRDKSAKSYIAHARDLAARMTSFLAERNKRRAAARACKHSASGAPSGKAGSSA
jgi:hypothetical protein